MDPPDPRIIPPPPRRLSAATSRTWRSLLVLSVVMVVGTPLLGVALFGEFSEEMERAELWRSGTPVTATVVERRRGLGISPRVAVLGVRWEGPRGTRTLERVVDEETWSLFQVGHVVALRMDATGERVAFPGDDVPGDPWWVRAVVVGVLPPMLAGAAWGLFYAVTRRRALVHGVPIPCTLVRRHGYFPSLARVRVGEGEGAHERWLDVPVTLWPAPEPWPRGTTVLQVPGHPSWCVAGTPDMFDVELDAASRRDALVRVLDRWVAALPPGDAEHLEPFRVMLAAAPPPMVDDILASLDRALMADARGERLLTGWLGTPGNFVELDVVERRALQSLDAYRHVMRHVALRLAVGVAVIGAGAGGLVTGFFAGPIEAGMVFLATALMTLPVVSWLLRR